MMRIEFRRNSMGYEGKLFGAYRATRLIMRDDFVDVYEGEHTKLHTKVAIRVADTSPSASYVKDFVAGAHVLVHLSHPNITRLLELGESNRVPFIILQPIKATLQDRYAKGTKLPLSSIIAYTRQLAEALQHAHNQGIVHREVKPTSIFMGYKMKSCWVIGILR